MNGERYTYAWGYRTKIAAELALEDCFAMGEVFEGETPRIESYRARDGSRRYCITLGG